MKVPCEVHGAHFKHEFAATQHSDCPVWEKWGMGKLPIEQRLVFWNWLFKGPFDEIWLKTGFQIGLSIVARRNRVKLFWQKHIKGYNRMSEKQRQTAQKKYILKGNRG